MISPNLISNIESGNAILFLGAGASKGATRPDGSGPPSGDELRDILADKWLKGTRKNWPLSRVAEYAKGQAGLTAFQQFVKSLFENLTPASFHLLIPTFRWHAIVTTNYDKVIEESYARVSDRLQEVAPLIRDNDSFSTSIKNPNAVPLLKLHGCISVVNDESLPLIMASEEYAKYRKNRTRLFSHFKNWAHEHPIIFVGYEVEDPNIQGILFNLNDMSVGRPPYAIVKPTIDDFDDFHWKSRRFETISADFESFLNEVDSQILTQNRSLSALVGAEAPSVTKWFRSNSAPSRDLIGYVSKELIHIHPALADEGGTPLDFYRGLSQSWDVFRQELDVVRRINDDMIANWIIPDEADKNPHCFLVKGHAGAGKSIALRRAAWDACSTYEQLIFILREGGFLRTGELEELYSLLKQRIVIVIDDIVGLTDEVLKLLKYAQQRALPITLICGARTNEWNVFGGSLTPYIHGEYELRNLSEGEIRKLLSKLDKHGCLGHLTELDEDQRFREFNLTAERQLLVALHEATSGKPFEEIIFDEYSKIYPEEAKILYLDICTLHRLSAPVRAGLINRVSGVSFDHFQSALLDPLQHVIKVREDLGSRDYVYLSRHPKVAEFVFEKALPTPEKRVDQIVRILEHMNVDYKSDQNAFAHLISGRKLVDMFGDRSLIDNIYDVAEKAAADPAHVAHQRAVFEINHAAGSARRALELLARAEENATGSLSSIHHTQALALSKLAFQVKTDLEKARYRQQAKDILREQIGRTSDAYPWAGLASVLLDEIRERIERDSQNQEAEQTEELSDRVRSGLIEEAESVISNGLQAFPGDEHLLLLQVKLSNHLEEWPQAIRALKAAFDSNPRNERVAVRLAQYYSKTGDLDEAKGILQKARDQNPSSKAIHYQLAWLYRDLGEQQNMELISHHLKRSFTEGDSNHRAQMEYARHEFLYGDRQSGMRMFSYLRSQRFSPAQLSRVWGKVRSANGELEVFDGYIKEATSGYCFAHLTTFGEDAFIYSGEFCDDHWDKVASGKSIHCNLAFTVRGPYGLSAQVS